jgi:hypothetical protein
MKFRPHELFLGVFLTVAVFAMGFLFSSSLTFRIQDSAPHQAAEQQAASKVSENGEKTQSLWMPTDSVGLYTLVLAVFTALLVGVSSVQGYFLLRADRTARIAANAADLSARAAVNIELPILAARVSQFGFGNARETVEGNDEVYDYCVAGQLNIANGGRTKASPLQVECGWIFGDQLPFIPIYSFTKHLTLNAILDPEDDEPMHVNISKCVFKTGLGFRNAVRDGKSKLWFCCRITYLDFMQERHEAGFCWLRYEGVGGGHFVEERAPAYNRKT